MCLTRNQKDVCPNYDDEDDCGDDRGERKGRRMSNEANQA